MSLTAREMIRIPIPTILEHVTGSIEIEYDDGSKVITDPRICKLNRYIWNSLQYFPEVQIVPGMSVENNMSGNAFNNKAFLKTFTTLMRSIGKLGYDESTKDNIELATLRMYESLVGIINDLTEYLDPYVFSTDILDFIELQDHPKVVKAMKAVENDISNRNRITHAYDVIGDVVANDKTMLSNGVTKAVNFGLGSKNQLLQCIGPRGFVTDSDFSIFKVPIARSFTQGMGNLYNSLVESRSAAKALYLQTKNLPDSEYFSRRLQLMCLTVEHAEYKDCGSTEYDHWVVKPPEYIDDVMTYQGDLPNLIGKFYLDETTNTLKSIKASDDHLNGKTLKLRSSLYCTLPNKRNVCSVCAGLMSLTPPKHANLGHYSVTTMTTVISQSILSTKHLDANASSSKIMLSNYQKEILRTTRAKDGYIISPKRVYNSLTLRLRSEEVPLFGDVQSCKDASRLNIFRVSKITQVVVSCDYKNGGPKDYVLDLSISNRKAALTNEFLEHIRTSDVTLSEGFYDIDLSNWNIKLPFATLPQLEYSHSAHGAEVAKMIESKLDDGKQGSSTGAVKVSQLFDLVNSKLNVNLTFLEIMVYAMLCSDPKNNDYSLSRGAEHPILVGRDPLIANRSVSVQFGYNGIHNRVHEPDIYVKGKRPDHPMDVIMTPDPVVKHALKQQH